MYDSMNDKAMNVPTNSNSSVRQNTDNLDNQISRLHETISLLQDKCSWLQTTSPVDPSSEKRQSTPANSELGSYLGNMYERLSAEIDRLNYTISSIDL